MNKNFKKVAALALGALLLVPYSLSGFSEATTSNYETLFTTMDVQSDPTWGLDRVDGTVDGKYTYLSSGSGVSIYVVDTGVDASHPDLAGRVLGGFDAFGENLDQKDCQGHGTHVAGVIAGTKYGVAKKATIIPVRVLNCSGQGNTSTLTAGIDWIIQNKPSSNVAIVNMSLGGAKDLVVNAAVSRLVSAGFIVTAAAGNFSSNACNYSPASADGVIAVGSIDSSSARSSFSNWGECVDIYAPGSRIYSDSPFNYASSVSKSGTSQASPFVAGTIASYISAGVAKNATNLTLALLSYADKNVVLNSNYEPNYLVSTTIKIIDVVPTIPAGTPTPVSNPMPTAAPAPAPISVPERDYSELKASISGSSPKTVSVGWTLIKDASKYKVRIGKAGSMSATYQIVTSESSVKFSNLASNTAYWVTVVAYNKNTELLTSDPVAAYTSVGVSSPPVSVTVKLDKLYWLPPLYDGGSKSITYKIEKLTSGAWSVVGTTTGLQISIPAPPSGGSTTYRVISITAAGPSNPSNIAISMDTGVPQVATPVPDIPVSLAGSVVAKQLGTGSGFVEISWLSSLGASSYKIQKSGYGVEDWSDVAATTKTYRVITLKTGVPVVLRVVTSFGLVVGTIKYLGS